MEIITLKKSKMQKIKIYGAAQGSHKDRFYDLHNSGKILFANFIYLHGNAESRNEFDLCFMNISGFAALTCRGMNICEIKTQDGTVKDGLIVNWNSKGITRALVCDLDDTKSVVEAIFEYGNDKNSDMSQEDEAQLAEKNPELFCEIRKRRGLW